MRLEPTQRAAHLSWAGLGLVGLGLISIEPRLVAYGAALLFAVGASRALGQLGVARARAAGFEMVWAENSRRLVAHRGKRLELTFELRNRDRRPLRFRDLSMTHAPALEVSVQPTEAEIPAQGRLWVTLVVRCQRVGYHGIHGLTLRAVRAPGLFTVPLSFASPVVLEVLPATAEPRPRRLLSAHREEHERDARASGARGDGSDFRELREHRPGDSFQRIAWKASARRGRLLVIEKQQERRDSVWFLLDASLESSAGAPGESALDRAIDDAARLIEAHIARGDRVGLSLVGARELVRVPLGQGLRHLGLLQSTLALKSHSTDSDRSEWDDEDVRRRVLDHLRSLDSAALALNASVEPELLAMAQRLGAHAPVVAEMPWAERREDAILRHYLLSFGIQSPPRGTFDRARTEKELARVVRSVCFARPRPNVMYLFACPPRFETPTEFLDALAAVARHRVRVQFRAMSELPPAPADADLRTQVVRDALRARLSLVAERAARELQRRGVHFKDGRP